MNGFKSALMLVVGNLLGWVALVIFIYIVAGLASLVNAAGM